MPTAELEEEVRRVNGRLVRHTCSHNPQHCTWRLLAGCNHRRADGSSSYGLATASVVSEKASVRYSALDAAVAFSGCASKSEYLKVVWKGAATM